MALKQAITNEKGASTIYHRVSKADLDFNTKIAKLVIYSYASEDLRQNEKDDIADRQKRKELEEELNELIENPTEETEERRVELSEILNSMEPFGEITDRHLVESTYEMPLDNDFSITNAYLWLKNNIYSDSVDV